MSCSGLIVQVSACPKLIQVPLQKLYMHIEGLLLGFGKDGDVYVGIMEQQRRTRFLLSLELSPSPASLYMPPWEKD